MFTPQCSVPGCPKPSRYKITKKPYCTMHLARVYRHGYPELKRDAYAPLEKLPHLTVDDFILKNCKYKEDRQIADELNLVGFSGATTWTVGYRRRKLGGRKYLRGEIQKHKAWIRTQAIKTYGNQCELCSYSMAVDTHHVLPKHLGGPHEINNLMVICPNCHALITRKKIIINSRKDIKKVSHKIRKRIKSFYFR